MKTIKDLKIGDRFLYSLETAHQDIQEGQLLEVSPDGKYIDLGYGTWRSADAVQIRCELPPRVTALPAAMPSSPAPDTAEREVKPGDLVRYTLSEGPSAGSPRPALVVRVWSQNCVNLQVITDGNGEPHTNDTLPALLWKTSVSKFGYNGTQREGTWEFPS